MIPVPAPHALSAPLLAASAAVAITHTVLGPDHYLPFLMLAHARRWSRAKTVAVTLACGVGHVGSSIVLGLAGLVESEFPYQVFLFECKRLTRCVVQYILYQSSLCLVPCAVRMNERQTLSSSRILALGLSSRSYGLLL